MPVYTVSVNTVYAYIQRVLYAVQYAVQYIALQSTTGDALQRRKRKKLKLVPLHTVNSAPNMFVKCLKSIRRHLIVS